MGRGIARKEVDSFCFFRFVSWAVFLFITFYLLWNHAMIILSGITNSDLLGLLNVFFSLILLFIDEKIGKAESKSPKAESSSVNTQSGQRIPTSSGAGFAANPFDFSAMTGLLNVIFISLFIQMNSKKLSHVDAYAMFDCPF